MNIHFRFLDTPPEIIGSEFYIFIFLIVSFCFTKENYYQL